MSQKVALVTGASHGIGVEVARLLAREGMRVFLLARNEEGLRAAASEVQTSGGIAEYAVCDVRDSSAVADAFARCDEKWGRLDVLLNNAGMGKFLPLALTTDEIWSQTLDTNLTGAFNCTRAALPIFERTGGGLIINNASIAAVRGFPNFAAYCASKAGLLGFSRAIREELREKQIRVSLVMPGATDTPFWDEVQGDWNREKMIRVEDVARIISDIALQPPHLQLEEVTVMPAGGAL